jgi:hypothetical protein
MTVTELIDKIQDFVDNTGTSQVDQTARRQRHLSDLIEVVNFVRYYRDWAFRRTQATLTVPVAGYVVVPADFLQVGKYGGVWDMSNNGYQLDWVPENVINEARARATEIGDPEVYSLFGQDTTSKRILVQLPPISSSHSLTMAYDMKTPTLDETVTNNDNVKVAVPEEYHHSVILPGLRSRARESKGDARWQRAEAEYREGLKLMLRTCRRSQGTMQRVPSFFSR